MFDNLARSRRRLRRGTRAFAREVSVGHACVFVDHGFQWDGAKNVWLTRARAHFVMGAGPSFDLRPRTMWTRVFGWTGRIARVDPYFDEFFTVYTDSPHQTWNALTNRARTLLVNAFDDARLESDGTQVTLWREAEFGREADAEAAAELVAEVVNFQGAIIEQLCRLPGATFRAAEGAWNDRRTPFVELGDSIPARLGPVEHDGRPVLAARAPCGRAREPFDVRMQPSAGGRSRAVRGTTPPGLTQTVLPLGAARLCCDGGEIILYWPGLQVDRDRLLAGANLVSKMASGRIGGLYR